MATGDDWSRREVEAAVAAYRGMLELELKGIRFNKAENNRALVARLDGRSRVAVEKKHQNISAILHEAGMPSIIGYKPLGNLQDLLRTVVYERIVEDTQIKSLAGGIVEAQRFKNPDPVDLDALETAPPDMRKSSSEKSGNGSDKRKAPRPPRDYLAEEARNRDLGLAGEKFIMEVERKRLTQAGKPKLAKQVRHVSVEDGDYLGFDIRSFDPRGSELLIEVKTTQFGQFTPFYASANEVEISQRNEASYFLYRVYTFTRKPRFYRLAGPLCRSCNLQPVVFRGIPK